MLHPDAPCIFGEVHKARHRVTGKVFTLKKIPNHNEKDGFPITALREIKEFRPSP